MSLALIYARSENHCIGRAGVLPWHLPDEFEHFNTTTQGAALIMGRKTYQDHSCVLPGRLNIVVTRQADLALAPGIVRATSLQDALQTAGQTHERVFVIGGTTLFRAALPLADTVYESVVHAELAGDTFIDAFNFDNWVTEVLAEHPADGNHAYSFSVLQHTRGRAL